MGKENEYQRGWKERLATFDFEVTAFDWFISIKIRETGERIEFHNDPQGLEDFINENDYIYIGFNNKRYDNYIMKGVLNHYDPSQIKEINDWIIVDDKPGWEYPFDFPYLKLPPTCDISLDIAPPRSLKECEGNMLMDIEESTVSFDIDHPWTKEEFLKMRKYCRHDVDATERLIDERMDYLEAKVTLAEMCGCSIEKALYSTNGKMVAISLGAEKQEWDDEKDYEYPDSVDFDLVPEEIISFFDRFKKTGTKEEFKYTLAGCPHKYGLGGIHGALPCYIEESTEDRVIVIRDVKSYYPTLLIYYGYLSRNVKEPKIYLIYYTDRIHFKEIGDKKKADALKLPLNTAYGVSLQEFNDMFDPLMGRSTCITGQVLLTQLIVELDREVKDFKLIQSNTDGIVYSLPRSEKHIADAIVAAWSEKTHLEMEEDVITKIIQKDVNNYIVKFDNGKIKNKGGYVSNYPKGTFDSNSLTITHEAIVRYFIEDKPVEETINECNDPFRFQLIAKTGGTYEKTVHYVDGKEIDVQKVNRLYAVTDDRYGPVKKWKKARLIPDINKKDYEIYFVFNKEGKISDTYRKLVTSEGIKFERLKVNKKTGKESWVAATKEIEKDKKGFYYWEKDTTQNCPEHAFIDNSCKITIDTVDKSWYINLARKRINDFLGIKEKKTKGEKRMVAANTTKKLEPRPALYKKIYDLGVYLSKQKYVADGYNDAQGYEYIKSAYYRKVLGLGCREVGLVFKFVLGNRTFVPLEKTKNMNLTSILGNISLIDPDTGEHEDYPIIADGSDNMDKGIYKAETMAIKYFVLNNFLLPETQDELDPEDGKAEIKEKQTLNIVEEKPKTKAIPTKEERKEVVKEVVNDNAPTEKYVKEMIDMIDKIQATGELSKGKPYGQSSKKKLQDFLDGKVSLTKTKAVQMMQSIEEKMDELGLE